MDLSNFLPIKQILKSLLTPEYIAKGVKAYQEIYTNEQITGIAEKCECICYSGGVMFVLIDKESDDFKILKQGNSYTIPELIKILNEGKSKI